MPHWKSEQLQQLLGERDPQKLFGCAVGLAQGLDMEFLGLSLHLHVAARAPEVFLYNNFPKEWNDRYQREHFLKNDPRVLKCHQTTCPVVWSDELFQEAPHIREAACTHGLRHGWTQSVHDARHNESQLSVARPQRPVNSKELYEKGAQVMWLCHTLHPVLSEYHLQQLAPVKPLSERELEVLKWSAAGKTAADVAIILSLSTSTVNFHVRSVIEKTGASNKAGAIAIAALRGLL